MRLNEGTCFQFGPGSAPPPGKASTTRLIRFCRQSDSRRASSTSIGYSAGIYASMATGYTVARKNVSVCNKFFVIFIVNVCCMQL